MKMEEKKKLHSYILQMKCVETKRNENTKMPKDKHNFLHTIDTNSFSLMLFKWWEITRSKKYMYLISYSSYYSNHIYLWFKIQKKTERYFLRISPFNHQISSSKVFLYKSFRKRLLFLASNFLESECAIYLPSFYNLASP